MSILKTIFRLFKTTGMYDSYTSEQQSAVDEICDIHLACNKSESVYYGDDVCLRLNKLEKAVSRRVLSASIPVQTLIYLLEKGSLQPGQLELVNVMEDIMNEGERQDFLNTFVSNCNVFNFKDQHQLIQFPNEAIKYLTDKNRDQVLMFKI